MRRAGGVPVRAAGIVTPGRPCHTSMPVFGGEDGRRGAWFAGAASSGLAAVAAGADAGGCVGRAPGRAPDCAGAPGRCPAGGGCVGREAPCAGAGAGAEGAACGRA
ncbi:hypothetical protein SCE1572_34440 [Sorangium cellulosum So0157-2]|uniref:Uncharacterized protein n=1 Tax=Sorangium cellulosum So0157-2 TaxID=1254432 RepID=S4Y4K1_SORCE|nr:hypothetical protein SCE1572_34440 [Sorangium cellulosum So0157-2]